MTLCSRRGLDDAKSALAGMKSALVTKKSVVTKGQTQSQSRVRELRQTGEVSGKLHPAVLSALLSSALSGSTCTFPRDFP